MKSSFLCLLIIVVASVALVAERPPCKRRVGGSNPSGGSISGTRLVVRPKISNLETGVRFSGPAPDGSMDGTGIHGGLKSHCSKECAGSNPARPTSNGAVHGIGRQARLKPECLRAYRFESYQPYQDGLVMELVDMPVLETGALKRGGSNPPRPTNGAVAQLEERWFEEPQVGSSRLPRTTTGRSSVWPESSAWNRVVGGSNPPVQTRGRVAESGLLHWVANSENESSAGSNPAPSASAEGSTGWSVIRFEPGANVKSVEGSTPLPSSRGGVTQLAECRPVEAKVAGSNPAITARMFQGSSMVERLPVKEMAGGSSPPPGASIGSLTVRHLTVDQAALSIGGSTPSRYTSEGSSMVECTVVARMMTVQFRPFTPKGGVAQLEEHLPCTQDVADSTSVASTKSGTGSLTGKHSTDNRDSVGSIPTSSTITARCQRGNGPDCKSGLHGFDPRPRLQDALVTQRLEYRPFKAGVVGSNPTGRTSARSSIRKSTSLLNWMLQVRALPGIPRPYSSVVEQMPYKRQTWVRSLMRPPVGRLTQLVACFPYKEEVPGSNPGSPTSARGSIERAPGYEPGDCRFKSYRAYQRVNVPRLASLPPKQTGRVRFVPPAPRRWRGLVVRISDFRSEDAGSIPAASTITGVSPNGRASAFDADSRGSIPLTPSSRQI